ncbi:MAG: sugar ABC transporter substrate-binding protein [Acholeplasmataceae bacterium]|nr:sugar ABC transporter substrate-binding protein [Acholeplasmataceae bacterium]
MKKVLGLLFAVALVFVLFGCQEKVTELQMLWWSDGTEGEVMQELLDQYFEETGVTVELVSIPYNDYETRLATMITGGEAPALARVTEGHLNNFKEQILSLDGVYDDSGFTNLFFNEDGDVISLPMDITANGLFVNTDLTSKYGVNLPTVNDVWTWAEFETEMNKLKGQDDVVAPGVFDHQGHRTMPLFYQHGIELWDTPYTTSNLKSTQAVEVAEMMMRFYEEGFLGDQTYVTKNSANLFRTGSYGFHMSGNWNVSGYQNLTFNWTVVPMPQGTNRATILGGKSLAAFANSGAEKAAKNFIEWMAEAEQHDAYTGGVPYLTPRLGAEVEYGNFQAQYDVFLSEIAATDQKYVQDWLDQVMIPGMYPIINQFVEDLANPAQTKTAAQLLADLETALKNVAP